MCIHKTPRQILQTKNNAGTRKVYKTGAIKPKKIIIGDNINGLFNNNAPEEKYSVKNNNKIGKQAKGRIILCGNLFGKAFE